MFKSSILGLSMVARVQRAKGGDIRMSKYKIGHKRRVTLAVGVVRNLERVLTKAARKRSLTPEYHQELLKCAIYLRRKRSKAAVAKVILPASCWIKILRFCANLVLAKHIKEVFDKLMSR